MANDSAPSTSAKRVPTPLICATLPQEASECRRGVEHGQTAELQLPARPAAPLVVRDHALALGAVRRRLTRSCAAASPLLPSPRPPAPSCASLRRCAPKVARGRRLMLWLRSHAVATPSAGRTPSNSGRWRLGSRRRALAATHPWLRAKENCISQSPPAERVVARWLFGGQASCSPRQRPAMIGVDAGRDAEGLCIRGVASLGVGAWRHGGERGVGALTAG